MSDFKVIIGQVHSALLVIGFHLNLLHLTHSFSMSTSLILNIPTQYLIPFSLSLSLSQYFPLVLSLYLSLLLSSILPVFQSFFYLSSYFPAVLMNLPSSFLCYLSLTFPSSVPVVLCFVFFVFLLFESFHSLHFLSHHSLFLSPPLTFMQILQRNKCENCQN